jgi:hypothetical protein
MTARPPETAGGGEYPYPEDAGRTHYEGCWRERGHHNCAVAEVERLRAVSGGRDPDPAVWRLIGALNEIEWLAWNAAHDAKGSPQSSYFDALASRIARVADAARAAASRGSATTEG